MVAVAFSASFAGSGRSHSFQLNVCPGSIPLSVHVSSPRPCTTFSASPLITMIRPPR